MGDPLKQARSAAGRGAYDEALVQLWNALEPARLAGDRGALRTIEGVARRIGERGDEAQKHEAQRLLEAVAGTMEQAAVGATERLDAEVSPEGEQMLDQLGTEELEGGRRGMVGSLFWLLIVILIIVVNVFEQFAD